MNTKNKTPTLDNLNMAHDVNNSLTVILGASDLAKNALPPNHEVIKHLQIIDRSCREAGTITNRIFKSA